MAEQGKESTFHTSVLQVLPAAETASALPSDEEDAAAVRYMAEPGARLTLGSPAWMSPKPQGESVTWDVYYQGKTPLTHAKVSSHLGTLVHACNPSNLEG